MSRIDASQCFCMDMERYSIGKKGTIALFYSAGAGYLLELVCENEERADGLMEYFKAVPQSTSSILFLNS